ncbi:peroxisomal membrane protein PEX14 [Neodiprion lecontei]|uniref:Peroxisomal membrane protein PEX14 n=1 Tax=Neodiprion lecontei TaxID=441921 RepID=A0A6J0BCG0_NEOLC|nr:peroxisomal membrane protein PEX14 [Neodiprion lecontei]
MAIEESNNSVSLRDELVRTAVKFLQNPKVVPSPLKQKQEFLRRKGLSENEIIKACEIAGGDQIVTEVSFTPNQKEFTVVPMNHGHSYPNYQLQSYRQTTFQRVKEILNTVALFGTATYCIYWFYKKFIEPYLFGRKSRKTVEESVTDLDKTIKTSLREMKDSISKVEIDVSKLTENHSIDPSIPQLVQDLKQDLASLKGLLLSRKQFPSVPASIPTWQLATSTVREKTGDREDLDDAGSGSSTNNSDSSLEMIREDPPKN